MNTKEIIVFFIIFLSIIGAASYYFFKPPVKEKITWDIIKKEMQDSSAVPRLETGIYLINKQKDNPTISRKEFLSDKDKTFELSVQNTVNIEGIKRTYSSPKVLTIVTNPYGTLSLAAETKAIVENSKNHQVEFGVIVDNILIKRFLADTHRVKGQDLLIRMSIPASMDDEELSKILEGKVQAEIDAFANKRISNYLDLEVPIFKDESINKLVQEEIHLTQEMLNVIKLNKTAITPQVMEIVRINSKAAEILLKEPEGPRSYLEFTTKLSVKRKEQIDLITNKNDK